jgi:hypothetical protein
LIFYGVKGYSFYQFQLNLWKKFLLYYPF